MDFSSSVPLFLSDLANPLIHIFRILPLFFCSVQQFSESFFYVAKAQVFILQKAFFIIYWYVYCAAAKAPNNRVPACGRSAETPINKVPQACGRMETSDEGVVHHGTAISSRDESMMSPCTSVSSRDEKVIQCCTAISSRDESVVHRYTPVSSRDEKCV